MKGFILESGLSIKPFGDPVGESFLLDKTLKERVVEAFSKNGIEPVFVKSLEETHGEEECIVTKDNVFISERLLENFLKEAKKRGETCALALKESAFTRFTRAIQNVKVEKGPDGNEMVVYHFYYVKDKSISDIKALEESPGMALKQKEFSIPFSLGTSRKMPGNLDVRFPVTAQVIMEVESWFHIWQLNIVSIPSLWASHLRKPGVFFSLLFKLLYGIITSPIRFLADLVTGKLPQFNPTYFGWHILEKLNIVGRGSKIHPTAVVVGCVIGRNVDIGPFALVLFSVIGDGVQVSAFSQIRNTVAGNSCDLIHGSLLNMTVIYPQARVCKVQASLIGRGANYGGEVRAYDVKLKGTITIEHNGEIVETGTNALGVCIGHGAALWGRVSLQHGRVIPNGYTIIENPDNVIYKVPEGMPVDRPLVCRSGTLIAPQKEEKGKGAN